MTPYRLPNIRPALGIIAPLILLLLLSRGFPFDQALVNWAQQEHTYARNFLATSLTNLGSPLVVLTLAVLGGVLLLALKRRRMALFLVINVLMTNGLNVVVKEVAQHPAVHVAAMSQPIPMVLNHPLIIQTPKITRMAYSFPSGHAAGSASLLLVFGLMAWSTRWRWGVAGGCVFLVVLVGMSRIYLAAHFLSDVLAGWSLAVACFTALRLWWRPKRP